MALHSDSVRRSLPPCRLILVLQWEGGGWGIQGDTCQNRAVNLRPVGIVVYRVVGGGLEGGEERRSK